jgi:hypothetical protein
MGLELSLFPTSPPLIGYETCEYNKMYDGWQIQVEATFNFFHDFLSSYDHLIHYQSSEGSCARFMVM